MAVSLNSKGIAYARNLVRRQSVEFTAPLVLDAADEAHLLGADGKDLGHFSKYHLGANADAAKDSKEHFALPFGKGGKVYRLAVLDAKAQAAKDGNEELEDACAAILESIDSAHGDAAPKVVSRTDYYDHREWQTAPLERTAEGYLKGRAVVTNIGVFPYQNGDGTLRYELRHPDDVFEQESLDSLDGKTLTNDHPVGGVDPTTVQDLSVGTVYSPAHDAYHITTGVVVQQQDAINAVNGGKVSLSCGYNCDLIAERGNYQGKQYTHRQKNIRYNHVALVSEGRAGDAAKLRMDGAMPVQDSTTKTPTKGEHMAKVRLDSGAEFEVPEAVASHIDSLATAKSKAEGKVLEVEASNADSATKIKDLEGRLDAKTGELDSAKTQVETLKADLAASGKDSAERIQAAVDARIDLLAKATEIGAKVDEAKTDRDIQLAIIAMETADSMEGKSDEYIAARVDSAYSHVKTRTPASEPGGQSHSDGALATSTDKLAEAHRKRADANKNAWKRGE